MTTVEQQYGKVFTLPGVLERLARSAPPQPAVEPRGVVDEEQLRAAGFELYRMSSPSNVDRAFYDGVLYVAFYREAMTRAFRAAGFEVADV